MNTINKFFFLLLMVVGISITGCVDNDFDEPENTLSIDQNAVITISEVLELLPNSGGVLLGEANIGEENRYIRGTVTADDESGNFFKTLTFQDATGALSISADRNEINAEFPVGNIAYVKLNGLTLGSDNNLPRLAFGVDGSFLIRIPDPLLNDFLIAGGKGEEITPVTVTINDILTNSPEFLNKLVIIEGVEFTSQFVAQTYADADNPDGPQNVNTMISDCDGNEIIVRNSGFADFASDIIPFQNGELTAIASVFGDDFQLFIRDTDDVNFTEERCDGSGGGAATNELTIQSIQDRFYDFGADQAEDGFISGTVISDRTTGQVNSQNVFLQNGEDGILVRFSGDHSFDIGTQLKITVSGQEVSEFRGLLQVNNVPLFNAEVIGSGALPQPLEITIDEILLDNNRYESTRVLIKGATLSSSGTWAGNVTVDDGSTGDLSIFTFNTTSYANQNVPSGVVDVIAIVSQFDDNAQLLINDPSNDVSGGTVNPGGGEEITIQSIQDGFYNLGSDQAEAGFITGTVISDKNSGQVNGQNVIIQNGEDGILVRFTSVHTFDLGAQLKVNVSGQEVSEFRGLLQVNSVPISNAEITGNGALPEPLEITIDELLLDNNRYESTRVLIKGAILESSGGTWAGNVTVDDGTETITIFTFDSTSYANESVPTGTVDLIGIVSQFDDNAQLVINDPSTDIQ